MNPEHWKRLFSPRILRRGEDYDYNGAVRNIKFADGVISAEVAGTGVGYGVKIAVSDGSVKEMSCTCPYASDGKHCKHMAAVLFAAARENFPSGQTPSGQGDSGQGDSEQNPSGQGDSPETDISLSGRNDSPAEYVETATKETVPTLETAVKFLSAEQTRTLLLRLAEEYPAVAERVMLEAVGRVTPAQIRSWTRQLITLTVRYSDRAGYMDYQTSGIYCGAVRDLLREKLPLLRESQLPFDAFMLTARAFSEAYASCPENQNALFALFTDCRKCWEEVLPEMNQTDYHRAFDWLLTHYGQWLSVRESVEELFDTEFQEEEFQRKRQEFVDRQDMEKNPDSTDNEP